MLSILNLPKWRSPLYFWIAIALTLLPTLATAQTPPAPTLISPQNGAVLDNGCSNRRDRIFWTFDWSDVPGATAYRLYVIGKNARNPVIDISNLAESQAQHISRGSYIVERNRFGWRWKVRARVNGKWSRWSEERMFDVEPIDTDCPRS